MPTILKFIKHFSPFFLGCETISILQWRNITFIRMFDSFYVDNGFIYNKV